MRHFIAFLITASLCVACTEPSAQGAYGPPTSVDNGNYAAARRPMPANTQRVQRVQVIDANGFDRPTAAAYGLIPVGWRAQGGVQWGQQYSCTNGFNYNWSATSPDGLQSVAIMPMTRWDTNNYGAGSSLIGCPRNSATSARQYLESIVAQSKVPARPIDYRPRPDLARAFSYLNTQTPSAMGEMRTWVDSGDLLFAYQDQGRDMRGVMTVTIVFSLMRTAGVNPGQTMDILSGASFPGFAATAPNGQLNLGMVEAIRQSFMPNPQWQAQISKHNAVIAQVGHDEVAKQSRILAETNDYVSALRSQVAANRASSEDRISRGRGDEIRGVQRFDDGNAPGGQVELSAYYNNAWRLNDGSYVLTDSPNFDPWRDLGLAGQRLDPSRQ